MRDEVSGNEFLMIFDTGRIAVVETHPVQYRAPVYRELQETFGIPVDVIYGSDFSVAGYFDQEFASRFAWDVDLLAGNQITFLSRVAGNGARSYETVSARGLESALDHANPSAILVTGYQHRLYRASLFYAWRNRIPILFRAETTDHARARGTINHWVRDQLLRRLYAACEYVLPIGARSAQHYRRLGVPERKMRFRSPYCVDQSVFRCDETDRSSLRPVTRKELKLESGDVAILFSGKLSTRKGVYVLVESVKLLPTALR